MISDFLPNFPYLLRMVFKGRLWLQCPSCGLITLNRVTPGQFQLECYDKYRECKHRLYGFGMKLWPIGTRTHTGRGGVPTDHSLLSGLREAFPLGEMVRWNKGGQMAHQLVPGGRELVREFVRQVRSRSGVGGLMGVGGAFEQVTAEWNLEVETETEV